MVFTAAKVALFCAFAVVACFRNKVEFQKLVLTLAVPINVKIDGLASIAERLITDAHRFFDLGLLGYLSCSCHNQKRL